MSNFQSIIMLFAYSLFKDGAYYCYCAYVLRIWQTILRLYSVVLTVNNIHSLGWWILAPNQDRWNVKVFLDCSKTHPESCCTLYVCIILYLNASWNFKSELSIQRAICHRLLPYRTAHSYGLREASNRSLPFWLRIWTMKLLDTYWKTD